MRFNTLKQTIIAVGNSTSLTPIMIEGDPGTGKTSVVKAASEETNSQLIMFHSPLALVEDFGVPDMLHASDSKTFDYKLPHWFPYEGKPGLAEKVLLCFDDRGQATNDIQKLMANILLERSLHGMPLARGVQIVSTGNLVSNRAGAVRTLSHLSDREITIKFETNPDDFTVWAMDNNINPVIIGYLRFKKDALIDFDPQRDKNATPRGYARLSANLGVVPREAEHEVAIGCIGEGRGAEFMAYLKVYRELPNPDTILLDPEGAPLPEKEDVLYAVATSLAMSVQESSFGQMSKYLDRLKPHLKDINVTAVSMALRREPKIANSKEFTKWAVKNGDVLY